METSNNLKERINDPGYQIVLGSMIDDFFAVANEIKLNTVFRAEAPFDMTEVMISYFSKKPDVTSLTTMFVLGVYMANKNDAILPSNIQ